MDTSELQRRGDATYGCDNFNVNKIVKKEQAEAIKIRHYPTELGTRPRRTDLHVKRERERESEERSQLICKSLSGVHG